MGDLSILLKALIIPIIKIPKGHPQSNGMTERYVQIVKNMLLRLTNLNIYLILK